MSFYSYIVWHETTGKRSTVGTPPPTSHPTLAPEKVRVGHSSIARRLEELDRTMARGIQETRDQGTSSQTHTRASTPPEQGTESEVGEVSLERSALGRVLDRPVDFRAYCHTDRETLSCNLSSEPCLATVTEHGMELSETRAPSAPEGRRGHCRVGAKRVASDKKKPHDVALISYSWMKVDFCSSPMSGAPGHHGDRHSTSIIGSSKIESLLLGPSAFLHTGDMPDCTCSSVRTASNITTSRSSCSISFGICVGLLFCCGIGERFTVIIPSNRSLRNTHDWTQSFSLPTRLNSTRPNISGIEPTLLSPIASLTLSRISTTDYIPLLADCDLPSNVSGHAFMQVGCRGSADLLFLYLCEAQ